MPLSSLFLSAGRLLLSNFQKPFHFSLTNPNSPPNGFHYWNFDSVFSIFCSEDKFSPSRFALMESSLGQKHKPQEFTLVSISELASSSSPSSSAPVLARFAGDSGAAELRFRQEPDSDDFAFDLRTSQVLFYFRRVWFFVIVVLCMGEWRREIKENSFFVFFLFFIGLAFFID